MKVDFASGRKAAEKEGFVGGGDYLKFKEGANRLRLLSECLPHRGEYQGKPNFKWLCYVLDREDGTVKVLFMPHTVYKKIEALQLSEDYAFDSVPMPYDITIDAKGAGTKEVDYSVVPARKNTPLTAAEESALAVKKPLKEVQDAIYGKSEESAQPNSAKPFDPDDEIPV